MAGQGLICVLWIVAVHFISAYFFDQCDLGRFPNFFRQARLVGIPTFDGTQDRRPLTIMSVLYRVWAKRLASLTGHWMNQNMPVGIYGGRRRHAATGAA